MNTQTVVLATQQIVFGTVRQVINEFLVDRRARGCTKRTIEFYTTELGYFTGFLETQGVVNMQELTSPDVIRKYLLQIGTTRNKGGIHVSYRVVKAFLNFWELETDGEFTSPMRKIKVAAGNTQPLPGVSTVEIVKLVVACTTNQALRDKAIIYFLFDSGVRAGELLALNNADVDMSGQVIIRHGKGDKFRIVFIGAKTRKALRAYLRTRGDLKPSMPMFLTDDGDRLGFTGLRQLVVRASNRAGVKEHGLHDFRRGCALNLLRNGCDLATISRLLGHSSLVVTQRYLAVDNQDSQLGHKRASPVDNL